MQVKVQAGEPMKKQTGQLTKNQAEEVAEKVTGRAAGDGEGLGAVRPTQLPRAIHGVSRLCSSGALRTAAYERGDRSR